MSFDDEFKLSLLRSVEHLARLTDDLQTLTRKLNPVEPVVQRRKRKDPNAPRGVCSAYTFFVQKLGNDMRKKNKMTNYRDVFAEAGRAWKKMNDTEKAPYAELARKDKERYLAELEVYKLQKKEDREPVNEIDDNDGEEEEGNDELNQDDESNDDNIDQQILQKNGPRKRRHNDSGDSDDESLLHEYESFDKSDSDDEEQDSEKDEHVHLSQHVRESPASGKPVKAFLAKSKAKANNKTASVYPAKSRRKKTKNKHKRSKQGKKQKV